MGSSLEITDIGRDLLTYMAVKQLPDARAF
jgi:hypothetical protein